MNSVSQIVYQIKINQIVNQIKNDQMSFLQLIII